MATTPELPAIGVGLGYRARLRSQLFRNRKYVDFLEIVSDHYLEPTREQDEELDLLLNHFTLIPHGLNLSLGSADGLDDSYLEAIAELIRRIDPPWWSEHIAFTHAGGVEVGHLTPLPFTREAVQVLCRNIDKVRRRVEVPLILENITYDVVLPAAEMTEAEFLSEVSEQTGCGLLLDVTNLYTNAWNHGFDAIDYLEQIPSDRIVQTHFVGGHFDGDQLVDSHSSATPPEVWSLLEMVVARSQVKGMVLERDEAMPLFDELSAELKRARDIGRHYGRWV